MHMLDGQPVHLTKSAFWSAGGNALHGTVPSSWASMAALQDLELDYNCGLCGSLPSFPMQVLAMAIVLIQQIHYSQGLTVCWYLSHMFSNLNFVAQSRVCYLAPLILF